MNAAGAIRGAIEQYGREVSLVHDGVTYHFLACVLPQVFGAAEKVRTEQSRFGGTEPQGFVYYGPVSDGGEYAAEGLIVTAGEERYELLLCRDFYWREEKVFRRALARRADEEEQDGSIQRARE